MANRPTGVTLIAILQFLNAVYLLIFGILMLMLAVAFYVLRDFLNAFGASMIILGVIGLILFAGLLRMKGWSRLATILFSIIALVFGTYNWLRAAFVDYFSLGSMMISVVIVIYLLMARKHFK